MAVTMKWLKISAASLALLILVIYIASALLSRQHPALAPEHSVVFASEFEASMEAATDWSAYLEIEKQLAAELSEQVPAAGRPASAVDRYGQNSHTNPERYDGNWNHSFEMRAGNPQGVAVLVHGLTDSPYSMLSSAEALAAAGYNVVVPRMPGHGFAVGGLLQTRYQDWRAAVRIAIRHAQSLPGAGQTFLLGGYSNGGLMAVDYALHCQDEDVLACPDALLLMSPAIDITQLAVVTNMHSAISWIPFFEKFRWQTVLPEIDPFKFSSFPKRAAWEIFKLLGKTHAELKISNKTARLPPILTFQSVVDNTVSADAITDLLYEHLPENGSRLVVYDVNSHNTLLSLMQQEPTRLDEYFQSQAPLNFGVSVLQNRDANSTDIDISHLAAGQHEISVEETQLRWPEHVFSLSHIALPFRADDKAYGDGSGLMQGERLVAFGALAPRGERAVMRLNADYFLRMRYNPFFAFQQATLIEWLDGLESADGADPALED